MDTLSILASLAANIEMDSSAEKFAQRIATTVKQSILNAAPNNKSLQIDYKNFIVNDIQTTYVMCKTGKEKLELDAKTNRKFTKVLIGYDKTAGAIVFRLFNKQTAPGTSWSHDGYVNVMNQINKWVIHTEKLTAALKDIRFSALIAAAGLATYSIFNSSKPPIDEIA